MDVALQKYPEMVKEYFMTQCVPINDHKFVMLHAAVWSGGTFIYIPKNVKVDLPLQAYFRMNAERGGQFEHTLIIVDEGAEVQYIEGCSAPKYNKSSLHAGCVEIFVKPGARARYYSIENWSKNTYNLNTKRALVDEHGIMEWVSGNMGSGVTMLYPCSILRGAYARTDNLGLAFAGQGSIKMSVQKRFTRRRIPNPRFVQNLFVSEVVPLFSADSSALPKKAKGRILTNPAMPCFSTKIPRRIPIRCSKLIRMMSRPRTKRAWAELIPKSFFIL